MKAKFGEYKKTQLKFDIEKKQNITVKNLNS